MKMEHQYEKEEEMDQDDQGEVNNTPEKLRRSRRKRMEVGYKDNENDVQYNFTAAVFKLKRWSSLHTRWLF